ncbi:alpha/beta-hydrolase [Fistulina hepatica ATCC 64428]|nr:alpha/beta-hydrolase [Fistulina hepatica ATCC 64428]
MTVSTLSSAWHITPTVIKTFLAHGKRKARKLQSQDPEEARDDIFFDEAFHIVKSFIGMGVQNTVESLQAFTNTHVPSPFGAAVVPVLIPFSSANSAADALIEWFGPRDLKHVVGGERWWQIRGLDGIEAEWITRKEFLTENVHPPRGNKLTDAEDLILRMEHLDTVMLYVHGGGYFWGSINTHRYQMLRYGGHSNAPQYPWPCPLQDVLAAYLYLVRPPPCALHRLVPPANIVFAGDSAGGGLSLAVLTVLRDLGMPLPAGAVLISPWVDLTHSFPSIMQNVRTDIIPEYGFLAKPSTLWPMEPLPGAHGRVARTTTNSPPPPSRPDALMPTHASLEKHAERERSPKERSTNQEMLSGELREVPSSPFGNTPGSPTSGSTCASCEDGELSRREPKPPKVLMNDPASVPLELLSQIQMYATTEQLTYPLVSPVVQGSLGNLPPLYIIGGNGEVLRDEIIYIAHKAAHPKQYPAREGVLRYNARQRENIERYTKPTKVHLQIFDDMCHVLTVFTFTKAAKYAYRSIGDFVQQVTDHDESHDEHNCHVVDTSRIFSQGDTAKRQKTKVTASTDRFGSLLTSSSDSLSQYPPAGDSPPRCCIKHTTKMIRERVDIHGHARPMEAAEEVSALHLKPIEIGIIKEDATMRWWKGQQIWDHRFEKTGEHVVRKRKNLQKSAKILIDHARQQGLKLQHEVAVAAPVRATQSGATSLRSARSDNTTDGNVQNGRRWGPLDLDDERPPPSAIAGRRDTPEALALLKKLIYYTAPETHTTVPRLKKMDTIKAALDPHDDPLHAPRQSVSEQQVKSNILHMHGLNMWDDIVGYFMRHSQRKVQQKLEHGSSGRRHLWRTRRHPEAYGRSYSI